MHRDFWEAGIRVFGLYGVDRKGNCECGNTDCAAHYKHPRVSNWQHTPQWSDEQIETMEMMDSFKTGFGVLVKQMLVIDVDARNGGVDSWARLVNDYPVLERCGLIVNTGSGGGSQHRYFSLPSEMALLQHHSDYPGIDFKSSGYVVGPGSMHKSGNTYQVAYGSVEDIEPAPEDLIRLLARPERHRAEYNGSSIDVTHEDLADMLKYVVNSDLDYEVWIRVGMSLHHATGGTGYGLWEDWSRTSSKFDASTMMNRWHSFGKSSNPVTLGTLAHYAEEGGWRQSVVFQSDIEFPEPTANSVLAIDLKRPPGFVGQVTDFINSQCRYPRETLAVAAALVTVGNIAGLRYADELQDVTTNMFAFCVAGSGSGKEAILQAAVSIHKAAGLAAATVGSIKSEQEIFRNLTRHQASYYIVDEVGILLKKIKNAQAKGGAVYLDGVIGALMSVYSKANGIMPVTGDMKEEIRKSLLQEMNQIERQLEEKPNRILDTRLEAVKRSILTLDDGIEKPFLSVLGFTTNVTFDELVDFQSATNGFIGRSILFNERETVPDRKKGFVKPKMPETLRHALMQLCMGGEFDAVAAGGRIEHYGDKVAIPTTDSASALLEAAMDDLHDKAKFHKDKTGLEALCLRAMELLAKVSFILAVPGGIRTDEHIQWAAALVARDLEEKIRLVIGNDRQKDDPALALAARIMNLVAGDDGETLGVICNRLRPHKKGDIEKILEKMLDKGIIRVEDGPRSKRYFEVKT